MPLSLLAVPHSLPQKNTDMFLVFIILGIILQLPLRTDGTFVSSRFTKHIICTCCSWDRFAHPFFNHQCTPLLLSPKEIGPAHVMFYSLQCESLRPAEHHWGFLCSHKGQIPHDCPSSSTAGSTHSTALPQGHTRCLA